MNNSFFQDLETSQTLGDVFIGLLMISTLGYLKTEALKIYG
jgi:hypothetical protein